MKLCDGRLPAAAGQVGSFAVTVLFALYNGGLGLWYGSLWHGSICVYYILLSLLRGLLLRAEAQASRRVFRMTAVFVLVLNAALAVPVSLMVLDLRPVRTGLIPAIASAAYTTCKISAAAIRLKRTRGTVPERALRMLRLVDALVSVLVLQNTMIVAVEGEVSRGMFRLSAVSSAGILVLIYAVSAAWFVRSRREA